MQIVDPMATCCIDQNITKFSIDLLRNANVIFRGVDIPFVAESNSMDQYDNGEANRPREPSPVLDFIWTDEDLFAGGKVIGVDQMVDSEEEGSLGNSDEIEPLATSDVSNGINRSTTDAFSTTTSSSQKDAASHKRIGSGWKSSRRKKKPKGMPKRPLSAYNLFFQSQRVKILDEVADGDEKKRVSFELLGKTIGKKWKALSMRDRKIYVKLAETDNIRYRKEMALYNSEMKKLKKKKKEAAKEEEGKQAVIDLVNDNPEPSTRKNATIEGRFQQRDVGSSAFYPQQQQMNLTQQQAMGFLQQQQKFMQEQRQLTFTEASNVASFNAFSPYQLGMNRTCPPSLNALLSQKQPPLISNQKAASSSAADHRLPTSNQEIPDLASPIDISDPNAFPVPPGMEITLNQGGISRRYRVEYKCYSMSRDKAMEFIDNLHSEKQSASGSSGGQEVG